MHRIVFNFGLYSDADVAPCPEFNFLTIGYACK